jgi:preprotein translocase subunit SecG
MREILIVIDVLSAVGIVGLVLLQQGKGADMGAAFGSGASASLFGARGSANFLTRATAILAIIFFSCNIGLAYLYSRAGQESSVKSVVTQEEKPVVPETPKMPEVPK